MNLANQVIESLLAWIDDNLGLPLRIEDIAVRSGYSKWHIQRIFFLNTGTSMGRYIRNRKLEKAAQDLCISNDKIGVISERYGYDSQQTFTRVFTKKYHLSPGNYRKWKQDID
ncbi:AraC family of transcriptional regulator, multidrug resistance transcriptional activator [Kosakonia oryzendophytica]|uniref:AraC family of transcriptional regulator, multidrug resistance transcriptional activator n=1 Tax=Kosakonia oryzendophytica TaxID=1005665 RepID=A0A1C4AMR9_9ENTR|nr:helix-turn-helix domain-containing protein [Kosakonia oryzendophytica]TDT60682.1 AraC family multidrug resistance transcriptional activator [Enterobacter sp. AG5470]WBT57233.1 helix-turn-helix domain-containing protein [Kosakonia oryzendophytica]SCB95895.1 AraC family of transcriptional regulator, multidrug resistance transcriptional activator [Kosakonia oryzendophytica]